MAILDLGNSRALQNALLAKYVHEVDKKVACLRDSQCRQLAEHSEAQERLVSKCIKSWSHHYEYDMHKLKSGFMAHKTNVREVFP